MIKVAVIGTGGISGVHLDFLQKRDDVEIVGLCDTNTDNLKQRQEQYGGEGFTDFTEMLDKTKPNAVWLCTPPQVRGEPLIACARRDIAVFCEKPVGREMATPLKVVAELAALRGHVQVGYVFRSLPCVQHLRKAMADDTIHLAQSMYVCDVGLSRGLPAWFYDKGISGGALIDQATHNLDLLRYIIGEVTDVQGVAANPVGKKEPGYTIDETVVLNLVFENKTLGVHSHSWVGDRWRNEIVLSGQKRLYRLDLNKGIFIVEEGHEKRLSAENTLPIHDYQNMVFLEQVESGDWSKNPSDFADATESLRLTLQCDEINSHSHPCDTQRNDRTR